MCYLQKNLRYLQEKNEKIYDKVIKILKKEQYDFSRFSVIDTRNGQKTIEIINGKNKERLNSLYNPTKEAKKWAEKFDFNNLEAPVIMFGIANGIFVREMLNKLEKNAVAILVEPDKSLFIYCLMQFDMTDIISDKRTAFIIDEINYASFYDVIYANVGDSMLNTQIICALPKMEKIYKDKSDDFVGIIRKRFAASDTLLLTDISRMKNAIDNVLRNLHFIIESNYVTELVDVIPKDIPFFIVSAGPSLDKNIDELKKAEGKAFILATDTAVKSLVEHNIKFSAIITVDPIKGKEYLSVAGCDGYPIFAGIDASNEMLEKNRGKKIWYSTVSFLQSLCYKYDIEPDLFDIGGSVATAAFHVAEIIGSERVVLIGQDLAYKGNITHAGKREEDSFQNGYTKYVDGVNGEKVKTRADWLMYLEWFERIIKGMSGKVDVIDATEGGAKINGTKIMKLSKVIEKYCNKEYNFGDALNSLKSTFGGKKTEDIIEQFLHMEMELEVIGVYAKKGIDVTEDALKKIDNNEYGLSDEKKYSAIIKENNEIIEEQFVYAIVGDYIRPEISLIMRNINYITEDKMENLKTTYEISKFVYQKIENAVQVITPKLHDALTEYR